MQIPFREFVPALAAPFDLALTAAAIGRTSAGPGLVARELVALRADGERVLVGANVHFAARATVHIAHEALPATIGSDVTVGRFGLVHACTLEDGVVVADAATVMDGSVVGAGALIAPGSLVPPRKTLPGGYVYAGNPATPVREVAPDEIAEAARAIRAGLPSQLVTADDLPPLDMVPFVPEGPFDGALHTIHGHAPDVGRAFIAPTAILAGDVRVAHDTGVFFGCVLYAGDSRISVGEASNVQDNSFLVTDARRGELCIGERVTIGHNVRMGSGRIEDDALVGMAARVADDVVVERGGCIAAGAWVEPGTVVRAGWIWAVRPARAFRELKPAEREWFANGVRIYVDYARAYRSVPNAAAA